MRDGLLNQNNNPEVDVDVRHQSMVVQSQLNRLRTITNRLKNAFTGVDVDWIDTCKNFWIFLKFQKILEKCFLCTMESIPIFNHIILCYHLYRRIFLLQQ